MSAPVDRLAEVDAAFARLQATVASLSDAAAREPSLLPGWTRGQVLTHIARNADGFTGIAEGARRGEVALQYPGGEAQRSADIERGAGRPAEELRADLESSQRRLVETWAGLPDDAWDRLGQPVRGGPLTVASFVTSRVREVSVHHVDLGLEFGPSDLPAGFVERERTWLAEHRTAGTWPGVVW